MSSAVGAQENGSRSDATAVLHRSPLLPSDSDDDAQRYALVVLNAPIRSKPTVSPLFETLWRRSTYRVCADGGANRLHRATERGTAASGTTYDDENPYVPDLICGDLDSLRPDVRDYYASRRVRIEHDPDQDSNDLDKALRAVVHHQQQQQSRDPTSGPCRGVVVYGAFGGRFDQEMASIQALYRWSDRFDSRLWLYTDQTCAFMLEPKVTNRIQLNMMSTLSSGDTGDVRVGEGPTCGLIPIGGRCQSVTTTGFKWNLDGDATAFGELVSTSNRLVERTATVVCSHPLVFTAEVISRSSGHDDEWD